MLLYKRVAKGQDVQLLDEPVHVEQLELQVEHAPVVTSWKVPLGHEFWQSPLIKKVFIGHFVQELPLVQV